MTVTFWGTATSTGVPMVGCTCTVCQSREPKNQRLRSSVLIEEGDFHLLIDAGPDFRTQALRHGLQHLESVVLTHAHADHVLGLDDLRPVSWQKGITVWADEATGEQVRRLFPYAFTETRGKSSRPRIDLSPLRAGTEQSIGPLIVLPVAIRHGDDTILGFRLGPFAYLTDCNGIPPESMNQLQGVDTVVIGVLRHQGHPTHFSVSEGVAAARAIGARQTYFTHMSHDLDHHTLGRELPEGMAPAYDGLQLHFSLT